MTRGYNMGGFGSDFDAPPWLGRSPSHTGIPTVTGQDGEASDESTSSARGALLSSPDTETRERVRTAIIHATKDKIL